MTDICYSGGCEGADKLFGIEAKKVGHEVKHFSFLNHKTSCPKDTLVSLNEFYLIQADPFLFEANKFLKRRFPTQAAYTNSLLRRNYYQIADSDSIYAISSIGDRGMVDGGTGWAVTMGICNGIKKVYLYDCKTSLWMVFSSINKNEFIWKLVMHLPFPEGKYAGIGKHDLPENGRCAIQSLYGSLSNVAAK